jgi:hypothetical protein
MFIELRQVFDEVRLWAKTKLARAYTCGRELSPGSQLLLRSMCAGVLPKVICHGAVTVRRYRSVATTSAPTSIIVAQSENG